MYATASRRIKTALSALCLSAFLLAVPFAGSAVAKDRDDRPANASAAAASPRFYYVYPSPRWGWGGWGWGPGFWDPYWRPYAGYYYPPETTGKVKIHDSDKADEVFLNGSFAGTAHDMKTMKLNPGEYRIEVRRDGRDLVDRPVYVAVGKTVKIDIDRIA